MTKSLFTNQQHMNAGTRKRIWSRTAVYGAVVVALLLLRPLLASVAWQGTPGDAALLMLLTAVLGLFAGVLALLPAAGSGGLWAVGIGCLGAGLLDAGLAFALNTSTPVGWGIWLASVVFLALMLMGSWVVGMLEGAAYDGRNQSAVQIGIVTAALLLAALSASLVAGSWLGILLAGLGFLFALAGYWFKGMWRHDWLDHWLLIGLLVATVGLVQVMAFSRQAVDMLFVTAVFLKGMAFLSLIIGVLGKIMADLRQAAVVPRELAEAKDALQQEKLIRQQAETAEHDQRQLAEALQEVGQALSGTLDFYQLLDAILDQIARVVPYGTANIMQVSGNREEVTIVSTRGYDRRLQMKLPSRFALSKMPTLQEMMTHGKPLVIPNTAVHPAWIQIETSSHVRSWAGIPIVMQNETIAFIALNHIRPNFYKLEDAARLTAFAGQVAIAIENARLYLELQRKVDELTTRNTISEAMTSTLDLEETLAIVTDQATSLLGVDATSVVLHDQARGDLWFAAASGQASDFVRGRRLTMGQGIMGWVAQNGEPLLVADVAADVRYFGDFDQESGFTARSILCVPLVCKGETIGAIEAINKADGPFDEEDLRLLTLMASPAATAIENAQLYKQAQLEISERKRAEQALEAERAQLAERVVARTADLQAANQELARAARLKDEFLASMSHELRTPLNAVLGMSEALQEGVFGELNEQQLGSLRSIEESGRHLLSLINDILDLSKIEAGKLELELRPVALRSVCESCLRLVRQDALKKQLKVHSRLDESISLFIADERRLKQILVNLLSNAVKFTPQGGELGLDVAGDAAAGVVRFVVWDTGIGISADGVDQLFQPFVQLDSRLAREYTGTGLGLSLVHRLATMHGGDVGVTSEPGQGSRFMVTLPWRTSMETAVSEPVPILSQPPRSSDSAVRASMPLVLLVEDNEANIKTLARYLRFKSFQVQVARNGREAVQTTQAIKPDIIVMDIQMPVMDGLEATRQIRAGEMGNSSRVPIIALTALAMPGDQRRCLEAGADAYLSKPVSLKHLSEIIEQFLAL